MAIILTPLPSVAKLPRNGALRGYSVSSTRRRLCSPAVVLGRNNAPLAALTSGRSRGPRFLFPSRLLQRGEHVLLRRKTVLLAVGWWLPERAINGGVPDEDGLADVGRADRRRRVGGRAEESWMEGRLRA